MQKTDLNLLSDPIQGADDATYRESIVTFVDILGFQALVHERSAKEVARAIASLQQKLHPRAASDELSNIDISSSNFHSFSDCIVRVRNFTDLNDEGINLTRELHDLAVIQAQLAIDGVFVRGGITIEKIFSSESSVFGPGLIRSYKIENELAHVPRIVVDPGTIQRFRAREIPKTRMAREIAEMRKFIRQAEDGLWFVDYLRASANLLKDHADAEKLFIQHKLQVTAAAQNVDVVSSVLPKYLWAAQYHNASCKRVFPKEKKSDLIIGRSQFPSFERLKILLSH